MEKNSRESFVFYRSWAEALQKLSPAQRNAALWAIIQKALYDLDPSEKASGTVKIAVAFAAPLIDAANKRYDDKKKTAEFGKLGGRPRKTPEPIKGETAENPQITLENPAKENGNPKNPNYNYNENDNENTNGNFIEIEKEKERDEGIAGDAGACAGGTLENKLEEKAPEIEKATAKGWAKQTAPLRTIEERKTKFWQEITSSMGKVGFNEDQRFQFYAYWAKSTQEANPRMRCELEKTWDTAMRMQMWLSRYKKYGAGTASPSPLKDDPYSNWEERFKRW